MSRRFLFSVFFAAVVLGPARAQDPVHFPDPNLKAAVEDALWLDDPTPADMLSLDKLSCFNSGVTDITGLEYAENLQSLNLHLNKIHDISPLSDLENLQKLDLSRNQIEDLSPLEDLHRLYSLNLHGNRVSDISVLAGLTNLENLVLRINQLSDIAALAGLTKLTRLLLNENQISDISALSGLVNLSTLYLYENQISDISPLSGLTKVTTQHLQRNQISNIAPLAALPNLTKLYLHENQISDISPLAGLTKLSVLWVHDNALNQEACDVYIPRILANNPGILECRYDSCDAEYGLIISSGPGGAVDSPGEGTFPYAHGSPVLVEATAYEDYHFVNWTGSAVTADKVADPHAPATTVTVDGNYTLIANFAETGAPSVSTNRAQSITKSSARFEGRLVDDGTERCTAWFRYWIKGGQTQQDTPQQSSLQKSQSYSQQVHNLVPGTTYCFQAMAESPAGQGKGNIQEFTTLTDGIGPGRKLHVDDNASNDPGPHDSSVSDPQEDGTANHPYDAIQEAIAQAQDLDHILVHEGVYHETLNLMGKCLSISRFVPSTGRISPYPVIDAQNRGTVATFNQGEGPNCTLSGLVLTGGLDETGAAIACVGASPTIENCLIVGNCVSGPVGAIVYCEDSQSVFENLTIADNLCAGGGSALRFTHCDVIIANSIVWGNAPQELTVAAGRPPTVVYNNIQGAWPGPGNMDAEPLFALPAYATESLDPGVIWVQADYHLLSETGRWNPLELGWVADPLTSPCVDAGDPDSSWAGEPQPHGARLNLGAYGGTEQASGSHRIASTVARWTFDESSGSLALDTVGSNHATIHGATRTEGILNGALQFDGVDDYLDCGNDPGLAPDQFTLSMWINPRADSASRSILRKAGNDKGKDYEFELFGARHPTFSFGDGFQSVVLYAGAKLPLDEWTHVTLTRGETEAAMYINGSQLMSQSFDFAPVPTGQNLMIGGGSIQPYQGKIDDVRIYDSVLFIGEIGNLVGEVNRQ